MATSKDFEKIWKRYQDEVQTIEQRTHLPSSIIPLTFSFWLKLVFITLAER